MAPYTDCGLSTQANGATDTLHVDIPSDMSLEMATNTFVWFGEVASVKRVGGTARCCVVFYDSRDAIRALGALKDKHRAEAASRTSDHTVRLQGDTQLNLDAEKGISAVYPDPQDAGSFIIEFYDSRNADRTRLAASWADACTPAGERSRTTSTGSSWENSSLSGFAPAWSEASTQDSPPLKFSGATPALQKAEQKTPFLLPEEDLDEPAFFDSSWQLPPPTRLWDLSASKAKVSHEVLISGLPIALLSEMCMEAILQQAGLEDEVVSFRPCPAPHVGEAAVTLSSGAAVERCVSHFHGRVWDPSGMPVAVTVVSGGQDEKATDHTGRAASASFDEVNYNRYGSGSNWLSRQADSSNTWQAQASSSRQPQRYAFQKKAPQVVAPRLAADTSSWSGPRVIPPPAQSKDICATEENSTEAGSSVAEAELHMENLVEEELEPVGLHLAR